MLFDQKSIEAEIATFNDTMLNIFRNFVPNKWINETIKSKIKAKLILQKKYIQNGKFESDFIFLENSLTELNQLISSTKASYYENLGKKLNNPILQAKAYWSVLKAFYNDKKILLIPPLLVDKNFITDIKTKANIFNNIFAEQCTPLYVCIMCIIHTYKDHGHDDISIRMIQICDRTLLKPLIILY